MRVVRLRGEVSGHGHSPQRQRAGLRLPLPGVAYRRRVYLGLSRDMAQTLALQTVLGSAALAKSSGRHPAELRNMVTSPGGTTAEALLSMEDDGLRSAIINGVIAAHEKAAALGEESNGQPAQRNNNGALPGHTGAGHLGLAYHWKCDAAGQPHTRRSDQHHRAVPGAHTALRPRRDDRPEPYGGHLHPDS